MSPTSKRISAKRKNRLQAARKWIPTYEGKNLVQGYRKRFSVDLLCAIIELEMLGHEIDPNYKEQIRKLEEHKRRVAEERKVQREIEKFQERFPDSNEDFYFVAGYTANGVSYGTTWEEYHHFFEENDPEEEEYDYGFV